MERPSRMSRFSSERPCVEASRNHASSSTHDLVSAAVAADEAQSQGRDQGERRHRDALGAGVGLAGGAGVGQREPRRADRDYRALDRPSARPRRSARSPGAPARSPTAPPAPRRPRARRPARRRAAARSRRAGSARRPAPRRGRRGRSRPPRRTAGRAAARSGSWRQAPRAARAARSRSGSSLPRWLGVARRAPAPRPRPPARATPSRLWSGLGSKSTTSEPRRWAA